MSQNIDEDDPLHPPEAVIKITRVEGGDWIQLEIHSLQMPGGAEWDEVNGWRSDTPSPLNEGGLAAARRKRDRYNAARDNR